MKRKIIIIFIILVLVLIFLFTPRIKVNKKNEFINYNSEYIESGYTAKNIFKDYYKDVKVLGKVNTKKVGKYKIVYILKYGFLIISEEKTVNVVDKDKPKITLKGNKDIYMCPNCQYKEDGYTAVDSYDGDITSSVKREEYDDKIVYSVKDSSGNEDKIIRNIQKIDKDKPNINLNGYSEMTMYVGEKYVERGYTAIDNCDGDITSQVKVDGNVNANVKGTYEIKYSVKDKSGNESIVVRKVNVIYKPTSSGNGTIYLTFDDGPSYLTLEILDILKKEQIKATFFVTNQSDSLNYIIKRAFDEGHTIGLHTYTHNYSYIYSSINNYFIDLEKISNKVYSIIGKKTNIIRFPGGSSNTVSINYSKGIMSKLTNDVVNKGYNYFDWNVDADDAGAAFADSNKIYSNVVNNLSHYKTNIVLMHDSYGHNATRDALMRIIEYAKNNGYSFSNINSNTPIVRHGVNN